MDSGDLGKGIHLKQKTTYFRKQDRSVCFANSLFIYMLY